MTKDQEKAISFEKIAEGALPFARTKAAVREEAKALADDQGLRAGKVVVSTWLGATGDSYALHLDSRDDGDRIVVHTWHSTGETTVRRIFGSFWHPRAGREGREIASSPSVQRHPTDPTWIFDLLCEAVEGVRS